MITLRDGSKWTRDLGLHDLGELLKIVLDGNFRSVKRVVLPQLGTDLRSRQQVGNRIRIQDNRHRTRDSRKIDLGLAMELLVALILSKTDSPDRVDSHCVVVERHPNNNAPSRMSDIQAEYAQSKPNERHVRCRVFQAFSAASGPQSQYFPPDIPTSPADGHTIICWKVGVAA